VPSHRRRTLIDLNSASEGVLASLPSLDRAIALEIVRRRPYKSWEDFKQALGFDEDYARLLRRAGARVGSVSPARGKKSLKRHRRGPPTPPLLPNTRRPRVTI
jgi:hypothetical protein